MADTYIGTSTAGGVVKKYIIRNGVAGNLSDSGNFYPLSAYELAHDVYGIARNAAGQVTGYQIGNADAAQYAAAQAAKAQQAAAQLAAQQAAAAKAAASAIKTVANSGGASAARVLGSSSTGGYVVTMSHSDQNAFVRTNETRKQKGMALLSEDEYRRQKGISITRDASIAYVAPKLTGGNKSAASTGTKQTGVSNALTGAQKIAAQSKVNASTNTPKVIKSPVSPTRTENGSTIFKSSIDTAAEKAQQLKAYQDRLKLGKEGYQAAVKAGTATASITNQNRADVIQASKAAAEKAKKDAAYVTANYKAPVDKAGNVIQAISGGHASVSGASIVSPVYANENDKNARDYQIKLEYQNLIKSGKTSKGSASQITTQPVMNFVKSGREYAAEAAAQARYDRSVAKQNAQVAQQNALLAVANAQGKTAGAGFGIPALAGLRNAFMQDIQQARGILGNKLSAVQKTFAPDKSGFGFIGVAGAGTSLNTTIPTATNRTGKSGNTTSGNVGYTPENTTSSERDYTWADRFLNAVDKIIEPSRKPVTTEQSNQIIADLKSKQGKKGYEYITDEYIAGVKNVHRRSNMSLVRLKGEDYARWDAGLSSVTQKVLGNAFSVNNIESAQKRLDNQIASDEASLNGKTGISRDFTNTKLKIEKSVNLNNTFKTLNTTDYNALSEKEKVLNAVGTTAKDAYNYVRNRPFSAASDSLKFVAQAEVGGAAFGAVKYGGKGALLAVSTKVTPKSGIISSALIKGAKVVSPSLDAVMIGGMGLEAKQMVDEKDYKGLVKNTGILVAGLKPFKQGEAGFLTGMKSLSNAKDAELMAKGLDPVRSFENIQSHEIDWSPVTDKLKDTKSTLPAVKKVTVQEIPNGASASVKDINIGRTFAVANRPVVSYSKVGGLKIGAPEVDTALIAGKTVHPYTKLDTRVLDVHIKKNFNTEDQTYWFGGREIASKSYNLKKPIETPDSFEIYSKQVSDAMKPTVKESVFEYAKTKGAETQVYGSNALRMQMGKYLSGTPKDLEVHVDSVSKFADAFRKKATKNGFVEGKDYQITVEGKRVDTVKDGENPKIEFNIDGEFKKGIEVFAGAEKDTSLIDNGYKPEENLPFGFKQKKSMVVEDVPIMTMQEQTVRNYRGGTTLKDNTIAPEHEGRVKDLRRLIEIGVGSENTFGLRTKQTLIDYTKTTMEKYPKVAESPIAEFINSQSRIPTKSEAFVLNSNAMGEAEKGVLLRAIQRKQSGKLVRSSTRTTRTSPNVEADATKPSFVDGAKKGLSEMMSSESAQLGRMEDGKIVEMNLKTDFTKHREAANLEEKEIEIDRDLLFDSKRISKDNVGIEDISKGISKGLSSSKGLFIAPKITALNAVNRRVDESKPKIVAEKSNSKPKAIDSSKPALKSSSKQVLKPIASKPTVQITTSKQTAKPSKPTITKPSKSITTPSKPTSSKPIVTPSKPVNSPSKSVSQPISKPPSKPIVTPSKPIVTPPDNSKQTPEESKSKDDPFEPPYEQPYNPEPPGYNPPPTEVVGGGGGLPLIGGGNNEYGMLGHRGMRATTKVATFSEMVGSKKGGMLSGKGMELRSPTSQNQNVQLIKKPAKKPASKPASKSTKPTKPTKPAEKPSVLQIAAKKDAPAIIAKPKSAPQIKSSKTKSRRA